MTIYHNKLLVLLWWIVLFFISPNISFWRSYPIKEVSKVACKFTHWSEHSEDCKIPLPRIEDANYKKYKDDIDMRLIYSVLWASTYSNWWDVWYWSHLWTDIATAQWTPVYSIWEWEVVTAWYLKWWWNTVVIKHEFNWKYIFSNYAHLDKVHVSKWDIVDEWIIIWEVWNTWNSWWNHIHFQIDINQIWTHPYYYTTCQWRPETVVEAWLCKDLVYSNTIDPIEFLETNWAIVDFLPEQIEDKEYIEKKNEEYIEEKRIDPKDIIPRKQLLLTELEFFLAKFDISAKSLITANKLWIWNKWKLLVEVKQWSNWKKFIWTLPFEIEVIYDDELLDALPTKVKYIENWEREIKLTAKKLWNANVILKIWWKIIWQEKIRIVDENTVVEAKNWILKLLWNWYLWSENRWIVIMKDSSYYNIIDVEYSWNFQIKTEDEIICPFYVKTIKDVNKIEKQVCLNENLVDKYSFDYDDTLKWLLIIKAVPKKTWKIKIWIYDENSNLIWLSSPELSVNYAKDIDRDPLYTKYIKSLLKKWVIKNYRNWSNFAPDFKLSKKDAIIWISNAFSKDEITKWSNKYITRLEFLELLSENLWIEWNETKNIFWDISEEQRKYANLLETFDFRFLDQFWEKYFQPEKEITRKEAAYILYNILENLT